MSESPWMTLKDAAAHLSFSEDGMWRRVKDGTIPRWTYKRIGREYRFHREHLNEWMDEAYTALRGRNGRKVA